MTQGTELPEKRKRLQHPDETKECSSAFPAPPRKDRAQARSQVWGEKSLPSQTLMTGNVLARRLGEQDHGRLLSRPETSVCQRLGDVEVTGLRGREIRGHGPALPWGRPVPLSWPAAAPSGAHPQSHRGIPCSAPQAGTSEAKKPSILRPLIPGNSSIMAKQGTPNTAVKGMIRLWVRGRPGCRRQSPR